MLNQLKWQLEKNLISEKFLILKLGKLIRILLMFITAKMKQSTVSNSETMSQINFLIKL